jgi:hypothetical protein
MGYLAPTDTLDVSNSNTPLDTDSTNPVPSSLYRIVAQVDRHGHFRFIKSNAYGGNNGRTAILNDSGSTSVVYTSGNARDGGNP